MADLAGLRERAEALGAGGESHLVMRVDDLRLLLDQLEGLQDEIQDLRGTPARPDWADAALIQDSEGARYLARDLGDGRRLGGFIGADGEIWADWEDLAEYGPFEILLDGCHG